MKKIVAILSIAFTLVSLSFVFFDRVYLAYIMTIAYAIMRWKIAEGGVLMVGNKAKMYAYKFFIALLGLLVFAGNGIFQSKNQLVTSIGAVVALIFAYDVWRQFKHVSIVSSGVEMQQTQGDAEK